jgi:hypothetical protein
MTILTSPSDSPRSSKGGHGAKHNQHSSEEQHTFDSTRSEHTHPQTLNPVLTNSLRQKAIATERTFTVYTTAHTLACSSRYLRVRAKCGSACR